MLGPLTKVELPIYENCLAEKITRTPFAKGIRVKKIIAINPFRHLWSNECKG